MSLRRKIIFLFGLLAIVPMLALAAFSYWHAQNLIRGSMQEQLQETAASVVTDLSAGRLAIRSSLLEFSRTLEEGVLGIESPTDHFPAASLGQDLEKAVYVGVRGDDGALRLLIGALPEAETRCEAGRASRLLSFAEGLPLTAGGGRVEAAFWFSDISNPRSGNQSHALAVFDQTTGSHLLADGCDDLQNWRTALLASGLSDPENPSGPSGTFHFRDPDGVRAGAFALTEDQEWTVVATSSMAGLLGSMQRLTLLYWAFVVLLGISTAFAFSIIVGRFTRSLSGLVQAAEEIGLGELDPWLPVPTSGELGQLTSAFNRMLARIRRMMKQVDQSGRLAVVGQLSAYLAHEIRNPLSSIKLNLQRLRRWTRNGSVPEFCLEPLEISIREVERLNAAVSGVLELSRPEDSPREVVSLHHLVEEAADLVSSRFRRQGVILDLDLDAGGDLVLVRPGQLKSVVLNLMVNALEAQPDGGSLEIRSVLRRIPDLGGPALALHFKDEGSGVSPEIRDRIFEPFFTTKSGGAGIGLAMVIQSVQANEGEVQLAPSLVGETGAEFIVSFPLAQAKTEPVTIPYPGLASETDLAVAVGQTGNPVPSRLAASKRLLTPGGLGAVFKVSRSDPEEKS